MGVVGVIVTLANSIIVLLTLILQECVLVAIIRLHFCMTAVYLRLSYMICLNVTVTVPLVAIVHSMLSGQLSTGNSKWVVLALKF